MVLAQNQVILEQYEEAPYKGVLVPELTYRKMHVDIYSKKDFKSELQECLDQNAQSEPTISHIESFSVGALIGVLIAGVLFKK